MPNIASARKRWRQSLARQARNKPVRTHARRTMSEALSAIAAGSADAEARVRDAVGALDRAAQKGIIHTNGAARRKSRLMRRANAARSGA